MLRFIWIEAALPLSGLIPIILPLLALQLHWDAHVFDWLRKRAPSSSGQRACLPLDRVVMQVQIVLVLALHCGMVVFFFFDSQLFGSWALLGAVFSVWLWFFSSQFRCLSRCLGFFERCGRCPQRKFSSRLDSPLLVSQQVPPISAYPDE